MTLRRPACALGGPTCVKNGLGRTFTPRHILLLLADGHPWETIEVVLFCSSRTIDRWVKRFQAGGVEGLAGTKRGRPFRFGAGWVARRRRLGDRQAAKRLRLPPQPLGLRDGRPAAAERYELDVSRGDGPPLAPPR